MPPHSADPPLASPTPGAQPETAPARAAPARADGVELIGEMQGSGYREPPALVRRADGQVLQLTPLLYRVLESVDGERDAARIAEAVSIAEGRNIDAGDVQKLVDAHLLPLGLLRLADGSQPDVKKADPLLRMRFRIAVTSPQTTRRLTRPFQLLFSPFIVVPVLAAFVAACWWVLVVKGLASATHEAFERPALLLLVFVVTLASAGFHEFGHAAAAARAGAAPGAMGAGLYLVWPAFYTDVTDSYRLNRRGRLLTDLGGLYFNTIVAIVMVGIWWATGFDAILLVVATQLIMMVRQLIPIVRFDGYHVLADATGVPDLFQRIGPTLRGLLPWRWNDPAARVLKPGARAIITAWVLLVVPLLLVLVVTLVLAFPRIVGTAWHGVQQQGAMVGQAASTGDVAAAGAHVLGIVAIAIPMAGMVYILVRLVRQLLRSAWRRTAGRPVRRTVAIAALLAILAAVAFAWWPDAHRYRPVQPYESGTLANLVTPFVPQGTSFQEGQQGSTVAVVPGGAELPGPEEPLLAVVLVPRDSAEPSWVFPFSKPEPASGEDTQALAVATADGSVVYDVAFALVWADEGIVDTTNEAYAFASCTGCAAVAVSFQVVLIVGEADVVVPQNLSAAVNYQCIECVAFALASQLVVTLDGPPDAETMAALDALWKEIAEYAASIPGRPLSELAETLNRFKLEILEILEGYTSADTPGTVERTPSTTPSPAATPSSRPEPDIESTPGPQPGDGERAPVPTAPPPTPAPTTTPAPAPSPSATAPPGP
jgi:putative peptide zinc metalloprotease protein